MAEQPSQNLLDQEIVQNIQEMSESIATKLADEAPPDPLHPKELLKNQIQMEMQSKFTQFFETFVTGVKELMFTLILLSEKEPELYSDEILSQMEKLGESLGTLDDLDETRSPKDICGITNETMIAFGQAVAYLYENKQYDKSSAVYAFLAFLNPYEPGYWLGVGNSEFFLKNYEKALNAYESAIELNPQNPNALLYSAHCYNEMGQVDKSIVMVDQALEIIKNNSSLNEMNEQVQQLKEYFKDIANKKK